MANIYRCEQTDELEFCYKNYDSKKKCKIMMCSKRSTRVCGYCEMHHCNGIPYILKRFLNSNKSIKFYYNNASTDEIPEPLLDFVLINEPKYITTSWDDTLLGISLMMGNKEIINLLLLSPESGINYINKSGRTALMMACSGPSSRADTILDVIKRIDPAIIFSRDNKNQTAIDKYKFNKKALYFLIMKAIFERFKYVYKFSVNKDVKNAIIRFLFSYSF